MCLTVKQCMYNMYETSFSPARYSRLRSTSYLQLTLPRQSRHMNGRKNDRRQV
jgi:hypothetical protein